MNLSVSDPLISYENLLHRINDGLQKGRNNDELDAMWLTTFEEPNICDLRWKFRIDQDQISNKYNIKVCFFS